MKKNILLNCVFILLFFIISISIVIAAPEISGNRVPAGRGILALYKSTENQTEKENEVFFYLSNLLKDMGLTIKYWDIDKGIPDRKSMNGIRAIITWFRGASMLKPETYMNFLNNAIDSGCKVLVFENFGAYQDRKTKKYVAPSIVNFTLSKLGIIYMGDWTDDSKKIQIASKESYFVEKEGLQNIKISKFYYRFLPVDRNLKVYLSLKRKDRNYSSSPVIVTNKNGGFALSSYVYRIENSKVIMLLNLKAFLREALFPGPIQERIALLVNTRDAGISKTLEFTTGVLKRARLLYEIIDEDMFSNLVAGDLRRFTVLGLILKSDTSLSEALLNDYLEDGGSIVSLVGGDFNKLSSVLAMRNDNDNDKVSDSDEVSLHKDVYDREVIKGYRFRYGFLLGEGLSLQDDKFEWVSGSGIPCADAEILAYNFKGDIPLLWTSEGNGTEQNEQRKQDKKEKKHKKGRVLVWNWNAFASGGYQGAILESFLYVRPVGVAATAGLGIIFIDDWPLPMYNVKKPPLLSITDTEYYTKIWWQDIKKMFKKYNIPFSSFLIFNYNSQVNVPFIGGEFFSADNQATLKVGREILNEGMELAFHGYNHQSLTLEKVDVNVKIWPSIKAIEESLKQAKTEWINLFGSHTLPFSYVAPNNIISDDAVEILYKIFPSIKVVSSLRAGEEQESIKEFGFHPTIQDLYFLPRTSWGYNFLSQTKQLIVCSVSGSGIFSHFIHPDDVFDTYRSLGMNWDELKGDFEKMLKFTNYHYPWLKFVSVKEAYYILSKMDRMPVEFKWDYENEKLLVNSQPGFMFRIRMNEYNKVKKLAGIREVYAYKKMPAVILEIISPNASLNF